MDDSFDLLIRGGTVATPNGIAPADVGVIAGRIAAIGALSGAKAAEIFEAKGLACPAGRHRQPGAFPRAGQRAQGRSGNRQPRRHPGRRHRRVRDAQHRSAHHHAAPRSRTSSPAPRAGCIATMPFMSAPRRPMSARWRNWRRLPGVCGVKAFLGSSTGSLLLNNPDDILAALKAGTSPHGGAFRRRRPLDRPQEHSPKRGKPQTHPVWRDAEAARASTERVLRSGEAGGPPPACAARHHRRRNSPAGGRQGFRHRRNHAAASDLAARRNVTSGWAPMPR